MLPVFSSTAVGLTLMLAVRGKLGDFPGFRASISLFFPFLPASLTQAVAQLVILAELTVLGLLLVANTLGLVVASLLFLGFAAVLEPTRRSSELVSCNCFGAKAGQSVFSIHFDH